MPPVLLTPLRRWACPNCKQTAITREAKPHARFHTCVGLKGLTAPFVEEGARVQVTAVERGYNIYPEIAGNFRETAEGETGHAHGHLDYLKKVGDPATGEPIGDTELNLKSAVAGETHEYTDMYPGMAKTARSEGFKEIADWFETLAKAEKSHAGRFQQLLDGIS